MLRFQTLPTSLTRLLATFRPCFTAPTFATFCALLAGMIAQPARRTVCGMLVGAGLAGTWHHSRAHWFFSRARWDVDQIGLVLAGLIVDRLVPAGQPVLIAIDDTLFRRSGRKVHAAAWQYDGAGKGRRGNKVSWGNNWLIAGIVVRLAFCDRPVCLPVAFALWRRNGPTKQVLAGALVTSLARALPGRDIHAVADCWYAGADGAASAARGNTRARGFAPGITLTSRLQSNAVLHAIATPVPGAPGRPRRIGDRLGTPKDLAAKANWTPATVHRYGRTEQVYLAETTCLWYGAYRSRAVRVILLRELDGTARNGYHLALITTDLTSTAGQLVARYAARWSVEVAIEDAKQITGVGQARNRTPTAVQRTVPFGLICQSIVVLWYSLHGHDTHDVTHRRKAAPWYTTKTQPAYQDMIVKLRRVLIAARFREGKPRKPTPEEIIAVHLAWAEAAA